MTLSISRYLNSGCPAAMVTAAAVELLFGGVDTTSHTVIFILYLLAASAEVQSKLYEELNQHQDIHDSQYLKAVIKEAMRMLPVAPANIRCKAF